MQLRSDEILQSRRPCNFAEVIRQRELGIPYHIAIGNFLDAFYNASYSELFSFLEVEPLHCSQAKILQGEYVRIAAIAEKLANENSLPIPQWVNRSQYFLEEATFLGKPLSAHKPELIKIIREETPPEFLRRNILTTSNVLARQ